MVAEQAARRARAEVPRPAVEVVARKALAESVDRKVPAEVLRPAAEVEVSRVLAEPVDRRAVAARADTPHHLAA